MGIFEGRCDEDKKQKKQNKIKRERKGKESKGKERKGKRIERVQNKKKFNVIKKPKKNHKTN